MADRQLTQTNRLLAIDTSTTRASIALIIDGVVYADEHHGVRDHARLLLPMIEQLLVKAHTSIDQLDGIVFGRGPGSFTGLRVACSVAKGLAYPYDLPIYPVSSLAAIAHDVFQADPLDSSVAVLAMLDARMHQIYWACYHQGQLNRDPIECIEQVSHASDVILHQDVARVIIAGQGLDEYIPQLSDVIQNKIIKHIPQFPEARAMLSLVQTGYVLPTTAALAMPIYLRDQVV